MSVVVGGLQRVAATVVPSAVAVENDLGSRHVPHPQTDQKAVCVGFALVVEVKALLVDMVLRLALFPGLVGGFS
jgi:hypothetical protein